MTLNLTKRAKGLVAGAFVAVLLLLGGGTVTSTSAQRVVVRPRVFVVHRPFIHTWGWGYPYYPVYTDPIAYQRERGYQDGFSRGRDDAKHGRTDDPNSHSHYRNSSSMAYREAFLQGYADGYGGQRARAY